MNVFPLLIQLLCGMVGGNIAGEASDKLNLDFFGNSIVGLIGGGIGGQFYQHLSGTDTLGSSDVSSFMASVAGGGIGGALAVALVGWVRSLLRPG